MPSVAPAPASVPPIAISPTQGRAATGAARTSSAAKAAGKTTASDAAPEAGSGADTGKQGQGESLSGLFAELIQSFGTASELKVPEENKSLPGPPKQSALQGSPLFSHHFKALNGAVDEQPGSPQANPAVPGNQSSSTEPDQAPVNGKRNLLTIPRIASPKEGILFPIATAQAVPATRPALIAFAPIRESGELHKSPSTVVRPQESRPISGSVSVGSILEISIRRASDTPPPASATVAEGKPAKTAAPGKSAPPTASAADKLTASPAEAEPVSPDLKPAAHSGGIEAAAPSLPVIRASELQGHTNPAPPTPIQPLTTKSGEISPVPIPANEVVPGPRLQPDSRPEPAPSHATAPETEPARPDAAQPLRSLSLEFAPEGAGDLRLRLSERSGEVHISVHSSDPSWSGRLHEGIHDLVGSLANAGYDADAWTPSQGQQQQQHRQPEDNSGSRQKNGSGGEGGYFGSLLQLSSEESQ